MRGRLHPCHVEMGRTRWGGGIPLSTMSKGKQCDKEGQAASSLHRNGKKATERGYPSLSCQNGKDTMRRGMPLVASKWKREHDREGLPPSLLCINGDITTRMGHTCSCRVLWFCSLSQYKKYKENISGIPCMPAFSSSPSLCCCCTVVGGGHDIW